MESPPPHRPKYVMLNSDNSTELRPPPQRRQAPRYHNHQGRSGENRCLRCICCCFCFWLLLIIFSAAGLYALYLALQPKVPHYSVDRFDVHAFNVQPDFSLYTEFVVTVKSDNTNTNIGFDYGEKSSVVVTYRDSHLCSGTIPVFHQPYRNISMIPIVLKGKSEFGSGLQEALMQNRNTGRIPLLVEVKAPVSVEVQGFRMKQVTVLINCSLVVDNLSPKKKAKILSSTYNYGVKL